MVKPCNQHTTTMTKTYILLWLACLLSFSATSQQTMGLFANTSQSFDGYTLFSPIKNKTTYLINNCGEKVHSWTSQYTPNLSCYLLENGVLLRSGRMPVQGGGTGVIEMIDWNGNVIWSYTVPATYGNQHHDMEILPNGNILLIAYDERTQAEVVQAGGSTTQSTISSEQIIEVQPDLVNGGGSIVWVWKAWDHLVQGADAGKSNYGVVAQHPEKIDINYRTLSMGDWLHINGIAYNKKFDQVMVSVRNFSELWVIDHSTNTMQAAGSTGGTYGKGGDLLYRWGNPVTYGQGTAADQQLFEQHNTHWIPDSLPDGGKIIVFNNQAGDVIGQNYSTVNIIDPPVNATGEYAYGGNAFAPSSFYYTYKAANPTDFYSNIISGAQQLENGNILICEGVTGRYFEVDANDNIVWEYVNPVNDMGPQAQGLAIADNNTFRCTRYSPAYAGFNGHILSPQGYIESGSTFNCNLSVNKEVLSANSIKVFPNPAKGNLHITLSHAAYYSIILTDITGTTVSRYQFKDIADDYIIDLSAFRSGMYYLTITSWDVHTTQKIWIEE